MDSGLLERLTKLKKERKLTLKDMADAAGVTVSAASHWLKGISNIRDHHLQRIADNYKLDYFELKYGRPARGPSLKSSQNWRRSPRSDLLVPRQHRMWRQFARSRRSIRQHSGI